jgi:two-component system, OmpR family, response regulator MprA
MSPMTVLLVDDDASIRRMLERTLAAEGYEIAAVADGGAAMAAVERSVPDAIVLDVAMPGLDGLSVTRRLRGKGLAVPILLLTARDALNERVAGLDAGADDYLQKPFAFPELLARLRALLRRGVPIAATILRVADLELDPAHFEVRRRGQVLSLTAKEFAILEYFMRHAGELVTRTMLLESCWDSSYDGLSNLVDVHISRLRRKVDLPGARPLLHTVRGAGFRLGEREP